MKILHVGWGFQPFRGGGLIEYAEDLMEAQAQSGYEVSYFCTGRFTIISKKPLLRNWHNPKGYRVYELWNPPIIISGFDRGTINPKADVADLITEEFFMKTVHHVMPDIVHFQEVLGVPTTVIKKLKQLNIKTVFTIEDYYYLCPTIKLVLPDGNTCRIKGPELGKQCAMCCSSAPRHNLIYKLHMMYPKLLNSSPLMFLKKVRKAILNPPSGSSAQPVTVDVSNAPIADFNFRRAFNLDVLKSIDLVIAMSRKVSSIFNYYQPLNHMITLNLTLKHINDLHPKQISLLNNTVINFAVINALNTPLKGRKIMLQLFEIINGTEWKNKLCFNVMGHVNDNDKAFLKQYPFVKCTGKFRTSQLNTLFEILNIHVGIVPSVWEEAYGYVGIEFMAKGIPVIGNDMGGIPDYVNNETGWLNKTCDAAGLYNIINTIIADPSAISALNKNLITYRYKYIKTMDVHFGEMDALYKNLINAPAKKLA